MQCRTTEEAIEEKELSKIDEIRKTKKQLKISYIKLSNCSITVRLRKLCNCLLGLDPTFFKSLRKMKEKQAKTFAASFLKKLCYWLFRHKQLYFWLIESINICKLFTAV